MTTQKRRTASPSQELTVRKSSRRQAADMPSLPAEDTPVETRPLRPSEVRKFFTDVWAFAVVIGAGPDGQPRVRRKLLLTAAAARKAVEDARARGQTATCVLVRVSPVGGAAGGMGQGR